MESRKITPQVNGRNAKIAEIDGPAGRFNVAALRIDKEGQRCFFYQDEHVHFYFYGELRTKPSVEWIVTGASSREGIGPFTTTPENEAVFRANIEYFLKTRSASDPTRFGDESTVSVPVHFTWRIIR